MMSSVTDECPCEIAVEYVPVILDLNGTPGRAIVDPSWIRVGLDKGGITKLGMWFTDRGLSANLYGPYFKTFTLTHVNYPPLDHRDDEIVDVLLYWNVGWYVEIPDSRTYLRYCLEVEQLDMPQQASWAARWDQRWDSIPESVSDYLYQDALEVVRRHAGGLPGDRHRIRTEPDSIELQYPNEKAPL